VFYKIIVLTRSPYVEKLTKKLFGNNVEIVTEYSEMYGNIFLISGRAPFIKAKTIKEVINRFCGKGYICSAVNKRQCKILNTIYDISLLGDIYIQQINAFVLFNHSSTKDVEYYILNDTESLVINTQNDFELALVLKKKELNQAVLTKTIVNRIDEKRNIFIKSDSEKSICLIGHSQIDNWQLEALGDYKVRNCGIRGISSFEYEDYILKPELLNCKASAFIVMHGTNDIVYDFTINQIAESICKSISYIKQHNKNAPIYFISCIHVNGRIDRSNRLIDELNATLERKLHDVIWIDTLELDDEFGNLKREYTNDGLHLSEQGYTILEQIVGRAMKKNEKNCYYSGKSWI
jgi:lysophospholipase L1-like esterase